jgi:hypothetical protein
VAVMRRIIWIHPFFEEDPDDFVNVVGAEKVVFGSYFPQPEGLANIVSYAKQLESLSEGGVKGIMGAAWPPL